MTDLSEYYNLIDGNLDNLSIVEADEYQSKQYRCLIKDNNKTYKGFILAKSEAGQAYTICDLKIQRSATDDKYQPRLIFRRTNQQLQDKLVRGDKFYQRITFESGQDGYREFWRMIAFLYKFRELVDLGDFIDQYQVVDSSKYIQELETQEEVKQINDLKQLIKTAHLTEDNLKEILTDTRKTTLEEFEMLLVQEHYWQQYLETYQSEIKGTGEEAVWHNFLKKHDWILGLNADIRFIRDFISEVEVGTANTDGQGNPKVDMLGISDYTVLIELKTPNTHIFTENRQSTSRANTWSFTRDFIDGISQCLGQKSDWDSQHATKEIVNDDNDVIDQNSHRTLDTKTIFIIGNKEKEMPQESMNNDVHVKRDTFQRFRRNNRNIEIITYDELYDRAYYIVYGSKPNGLEY